MLKAIVTYHDKERAPFPVVMGTSEDVRAPRGLKALEKGGVVVDDNVELTYKTWLAAKRQGDVGESETFEAWADSVLEIEPRLSARQIEEAVAMGSMTRENGDGLLTLMADEDAGESPTPRTE